jgi:hypothetical protein
MATGQYQTGGLFSRPDVETLGIATWADMTGVDPNSPLVGGRNVPTGGVEPQYKYRRVALAAGPSTPTGHAPMHAHFSEILNFRHSPMPWLLLAAILYLGLIHLHVTGQVGAGVGRK